MSQLENDQFFNLRNGWIRRDIMGTAATFLDWNMGIIPPSWCDGTQIWIDMEDPWFPQEMI